MRHRGSLLLVDTVDVPAPAPTLEGPRGRAAPSPSTVGDIGQIPLPPITDMRFQDEVMSRGTSDPHVDIVIMYRRRCGHCKPEIQRVYKYLLTHQNCSAWVVEVDADRNVDWLKSQLLDAEEATPSTGYWCRGQLMLSSPQRKENQSVEHWVELARRGGPGTLPG